LARKKSKKGKTQTEKRRQERLRRLKDICCGMAIKDTLGDEEMNFLKKYFRWDTGLLAEIERTRQRPFFADPNGFYKKCKICGAFRNYCCC
jgi:hypothetical protein